MTDARVEPSRETPGIDKLTIFTFLWACQAMVHQEFYSQWLQRNDPFGWGVTFFAVATLVSPRTLSLFVCMLLSSTIYNFLKWPFVVNHILVETVINVTCLLAIAITVLTRRSDENLNDTSVRDRIFDRCAPVIVLMLILIYYFAFVAKLNWGFVNAEVSCVVVMYGDLLRRFPFLPGKEAAGEVAIALTLFVELLIPLLLTFRKTRLLGIMLGVPFHLVLGLVGHRTFSALAFALYAVICIDQLTVICDRGWSLWTKRASPQFRRMTRFAVSLAIVLGTATLIAADLLGRYKDGLGPLKFFRIPWLIWILWSLVLGAIYAACMIYFYRRPQPPREKTAYPGILWILVSLVILNGMSQYLGFKTETCFTMYSNLRTEGTFNNHMFMPRIRLAHYQDDLVQVASTTIPELEKYVHDELLITYFELRRIVSSSTGDFELIYVRNGEVKRLTRIDDRPSEASELLKPHPYWKAKLLLFRPVSTAVCAPCQH